MELALTLWNDINRTVQNVGKHIKEEILVSENHPFYKSNLFIFLLGQAFAFICWAIVAAGVYGKLTQQLSEIMDWRGKTDTKIVQIDKDASLAVSTSDKQNWMLQNDEKRILFLEDQSRKTDVMVEKVSRIDEIVKRLEERK